MLKKYFLLLVSFATSTALHGTMKPYPYRPDKDNPRAAYQHYTIEYLRHVKSARTTLGKETADIDQGLTTLENLSGYKMLSIYIDTFYRLHATTVAKIETKRSQLPPRQNRGMSITLTPEIRLGAASSKITTAIENFNQAVTDIMNSAQGSNPPHVNCSDQRIMSDISNLEKLAGEVDTIIAEMDAKPETPQFTPQPAYVPLSTSHPTSTPAPSVNTTSSSSFSSRTSSSSSSNSFTFSRPSAANTAGSSSSSSSASPSSTKSSTSSSKSPNADKTSFENIAAGTAVVSIPVAIIQAGRLFDKLYTDIRTAETHISKQDAAIKALKQATAEVSKNPLQHKVLVFSSMLGILSAAVCLLK